uniref:RING-H2 finger protein ATL68-like n=1 Tax=Fragaria vesca subsp. vesca TaxID=101020 RepID=UPI0005CA9D9F|nr:PREDICTED: RING-H2 finger protein ATL68-like [Fragaria vesca subsp. vesca]
MAMAMASDYWEVVGDALCDVRVVGFTELENELLCNYTNTFLMEFEAVFRRVTSEEADRLLDDDIIPRQIVNMTSIELDDSDSSYMDAVLSETLQQLQVPLEERSCMVKKVMFRASEAAQNAGGKRVRMRVDIDLYVVDDDIDEEANGGVGGIIGDSYEPRFVPASTMSIEKLERTRVQVPSTMCSVCMEEMMLGFEATKMPCLHLYHEACIVEWLQQSGVCPLCKFRMP